MKRFQTVRMLNDHYRSGGIEKGAIGCILEIYDENHCEIEFVAEDGTTIACMAVHRKDFAVIEDESQGLRASDSGIS